MELFGRNDGFKQLKTWHLKKIENLEFFKKVLNSVFEPMELSPLPP
jgi:hypothetical protein